MLHSTLSIMGSNKIKLHTVDSIRLFPFTVVSDGRILIAEWGGPW